MIGKLTRWWWAGALAGILLLGAGVTALVLDDGSPARTGAGPCHEREPDLVMTPVAVSPNGKYVLGEDREVGWGVKHGGEFTPLDDAPGEGMFTDALDVNDSGSVVGVTDSGEDNTVGAPGYGEQTVAWIYEDGEFRRLEGLPDSPIAHAAALDNSGAVVGHVGLEEEEEHEPVRWAAGATEASPLPLGEYDYGKAVDVSADGTVVGSLSGAEDPGDAWLWPAEGSGRKLLSPDQDRSSEAAAIAGDWALVHTEFDTVRVDLGDGFESETIDAVIGRVIDERGRIYGNDHKWNAVVYDDERVTLPGLETPPEREGDDPDQSRNDVLAAAADGSVVYGQTFDGGTVEWACD